MRLGGGDGRGRKAAEPEPGPQPEPEPEQEPVSDLTLEPGYDPTLEPEPQLEPRTEPETEPAPQQPQQGEPAPDELVEEGVPPTSACLLCSVKVGTNHLAQHFAECFDEHCPVDVAPGDEDGLVQSHSVALCAQSEELDALRVALFDESTLGEPIPASVVMVILEKLDMATLGRLGCVSRGWQKLCRVSCRVHCAHEVRQLAQLLPDRHMQFALEFVGRTAAEQNRRVCQLEQRKWPFTGDAVTIEVKTLTGKCNVYHICSAQTGGSTRVGVLGAICAGDLCRLVHNDEGCPVEQILLMDRDNGRAMLHWDVPLIFYTTPDAEGHICVEMGLLSARHPLDRESVTSFETLVRKRGALVLER
jgi:hypothetical protein